MMMPCCNDGYSPAFVDCGSLQDQGIPPGHDGGKQSTNEWVYIDFDLQRQAPSCLEDDNGVIDSDGYRTPFVDCTSLQDQGIPPRHDGGKQSTNKWVFIAFDLQRQVAIVTGSRAAVSAKATEHLPRSYGRGGRAPRESVQQCSGHG